MPLEISRLCVDPNGGVNVAMYEYLQKPTTTLENLLDLLEIEDYDRSWRDANEAEIGDGDR